MCVHFSVSPEEALAKWFPQASGFRDRQREAMARIWDGQSSLVLMPTGMGKSLALSAACSRFGWDRSHHFTADRPDAATDGDSPRFRGGGPIARGRDALDAQEALRRFPWTKGPAFLFVSPERAETDGYLEHLLRKRRHAVSLVAVDEAHCISQWGHDFRPPYKAIPGFLDRAFGRGSWPTVMCLTATLDRHDQDEVLIDLRLTRQDVCAARTCGGPISTSRLKCLRTAI